VTRRIDVVADSGIPDGTGPNGARRSSGFMTWPHVESDGILCLLPNMAECDPR
jgi:hypothetical protein